MARVGPDVDELADVLVRAVVPISVAAVLALAATVTVAAISLPAAAVLATLHAHRRGRGALACRPSRRNSGRDCPATSFRT